MSVALYAYRLAHPQPTGVDRYVSELTRALAKQFPGRYQMLASPEKRDAHWVPPDVQIARLPGPRRALHLAWALFGRPQIDRYVPDADLLHVLLPTWPVPSRIPVVYTFHDVMPVANPEWFPARETWLFRAAARDAAARAARVVAVSATVAEAVTAHIGIERERISVVHEGVDDRFRSAPPTDAVRAVCQRFGVEEGRYLIYVGRISTRKNVMVLVEAIARRGPGARLLVVGPPGLGIDQVTSGIERLGVDTDVILPGHVPDEDLPALMTGALALVHPSRYEGFGLTPLEAMALGTPAIGARAGALPEVLGDAALLLDPDDIEAWADALTRIEQDAGYARALGERGRRHALDFTWERAAGETAAVHEAVLAEAPP